MKVLVLGSAGQIGHRLCKVLRDSNNEVVEYDIISCPSQDLRYYRPELLDLITQADFVMFLAFDVGGSTYLKEYEKTMGFVNNNCDIMRNTFSILNTTKTPFIFASSQMSNMSHSPYGILKALGETYTHILNGKVVKFWNVYDVETDPSKFHVVSDFLVSAKENGVINGKTTGTELRQFLHGYDASVALMTIMNEFNRIKEDELHITSFVWNSIIDVANIVANIHPCEINFSTKLDLVQHDKRNEPNKNILKYWSPSIDLSSGIKLVSDGMFSNE